MAKFLRGVPAIARHLVGGVATSEEVRRIRHIIDNDPDFPAKMIGGLWVSTDDALDRYVSGFGTDRTGDIEIGKPDAA